MSAGVALDGRRGLAHRTQTPAGQLAVCAVCAAMLIPVLGWMALPVSLVLYAANWKPAKRRATFSALAAALCILGLAPSSRPVSLALALLAATIAFAVGLILWAQRFPALPGALTKRPQLLLHTTVVTAVLLLWVARRSNLAGVASTGLLMALLSELLWRGSYWIKWRPRKTGPVRAGENLFTLIPFLGTGGVPYGKNPEYFGRYEAADDAQLAAARLRALQLLTLAIVWRIVLALMAGWLFGEPAALMKGIEIPALAGAPFLPTMEALLTTPAAFPLWQRWAGLFAELFHDILTLALYGHGLVAVYCLAGFRIPRNTDAPLFATTILDFWSRYYFYFKEVLMDFFFFPVYLRAKALPAIPRTLLATVAAAFAGNIYYHLILNSQLLVTRGAHYFAAYAAQRAVYSSFLAGGLCFSFARALSSRPSAPLPWPRRIGGMFLAGTFFALIHVWNYGDPGITLRQRADLIISLFSVS